MAEVGAGVGYSSGPVIGGLLYKVLIIIYTSYIISMPYIIIIIIIIIIVSLINNLKCRGTANPSGNLT